MSKITQSTINKLEEVLVEGGYAVRYEKGNFKTGYCLLEHKKVVVVNKFVPIESKAASLTEIIKLLGLSRSEGELLPLE